MIWTYQTIVESKNEYFYIFSEIRNLLFCKLKISWENERAGTDPGFLERANMYNDAGDHFTGCIKSPMVTETMLFYFHMIRNTEAEKGCAQANPVSPLWIRHWRE